MFRSLAGSDDRRGCSIEAQHLADIVLLVLAKYSTFETQHRYFPEERMQVFVHNASRCVST